MGPGDGGTEPSPLGLGVQLGGKPLFPPWLSSPVGESGPCRGPVICVHLGARVSTRRGGRGFSGVPCPHWGPGSRVRTQQLSQEAPAGPHALSAVCCPPWAWGWRETPCDPGRGPSEGAGGAQHLWERLWAPKHLPQPGLGVGMAHLPPACSAPGKLADERIGFLIDEAPDC